MDNVNINENVDLTKITIAEFRTALYHNEKEMENCFKKGNIKGFFTAYKYNLKLNKLLSKKRSLDRKQIREEELNEKQL